MKRGEFLGRENGPNEAREARFSAKFVVSSSAAVLLLGGCVSAPVVNAAPSGCSSLVPSGWKQGVEGVDPPGANGQPTTIADWEVGFDGQTGRLDQANGRTRDAISIVTSCEARDAAAVKKATRARLFGIPL